MFAPSLLHAESQTYLIPALGIAAGFLAIWIGKNLAGGNRGQIALGRSGKLRLNRLTKSQQCRLAAKVEATLRRGGGFLGGIGERQLPSEEHSPSAKPLRPIVDTVCR